VWVGADYQIMDVGENEVFGLNFVNDLPSGDSILSVVFTLTVKDGYGTDPNPSAHLNGTPGVSGTTALQRLSGLLPGVTYILQAIVTTALGNTISLYSHVPTQSPS
jgi:hypothetical protein